MPCVGTGIIPYFYPRPPRGGRPFSLGILPPVSIFLSTPSARRATPAHALCDPADDLFLSTPSARRATAAYRAVFRCRSISIHALREEGDGSGFSVVEVLCLFLSTPSARRATPSRASRWPSSTTFLSTPSARRATIYRFSTGVPILDFYPRPPRGGRLEQTMEVFIKRKISIHALREEGDEQVQRYIDVGKKFLSTPSARRATVGVAQFCIAIGISIHALREEGDRQQNVGRRYIHHFYPRPPRGGRLGADAIIGVRFQFLSTPSARRATSYDNIFCSRLCDFYPRPPRGGRRSM